MRETVLILAVLGGLLSAVLGCQWYNAYQQIKPGIDRTRQVNNPHAQALVAEVDRTVASLYLLMLALPLGGLGGVLAMQGYRKLAALILIAAGVAPVVFRARALLTASLLFLAALLALFIRPDPPAPAPARRRR